jgi:Flp pilus assembly protein TadG
MGLAVMQFNFCSKLQALIARVLPDAAGQVALTFGLTLVPMLLAIGCGVDISRAMVVKMRLGEALDAAGLAVGTTAGLTDAQMTETARRYFYANYPGVELGTVTSLNVSKVGQGGNRIAVSGAARVPTAFMKLAGIEYLDVDVNVEVMREAQSLDVVLVLDTTGSMAGTKLSTLKTAATDLVKKLLVSPTVKIGIVPFARYVHIGMGNRNRPGVSVPADSNTCQTVNRQVQTCAGTEQYQSTCSRNVNPRPGTCFVDGAPQTCTLYDTLTYACTKTRGTNCTTRTVPTQQCSSQVWYGCVGSRTPTLNARDDRFSTGLPGLMNITCGKPLVQLTNQQANLLASIASFVAAENTYVPAGLSVGWHVLSPGIPFTEATPANADPKPRRAMVLMTDGDNTVSLTSSGPLHNGSSRAAADTLTKQLCANIKADGVEVYTVAFEIKDAATKDMIRACASNPANYFDASDPTKLLSAFENIAMALSNLRLSR